MKEYVYDIDPMGNVTGIYLDCLSNLGKSIARVSEVEYNNDIQKWVITFLEGPFKNACYIKTFTLREDALNQEVIEINNWLINK